MKTEHMVIFISYHAVEGITSYMIKGKRKSSNEPSDPSDGRLSPVSLSWREMARSISTPPWMGC